MAKGKKSKDPRLEVSPVYFDPTIGKPVSTHSMLKTFRRCPKQAEYKYVERLKPKVLGKPLRRGTWIHALLEAYFKGQDWRAKHAELTKQFRKLFDEERDALGDLPNEMKRLMKAYLWHYKLDEWKILDTEFTLEVEFPDGTVYRCKIDLLIENAWGLWIVDHKSHIRLPNLSYRILDAQSALYIWAAWANGIRVNGHIWNYLRAKAPTVPVPLVSGRGFARMNSIDTDYLTLKAAVKEHGMQGFYEDKLKALKAQRYVPGQPQTSSFFRRDVLEKSPELIERVVNEAYHTSIRMHNYTWSDTDFVERVPDRSCTFMCSYTDLCTTELFGGNAVILRKNKYDTGDPMDYYNDDRQEKET